MARARLSTYGQALALEAWAAAAAGGSVCFYAGVVPASADAPPEDAVLLAEARLGEPAFDRVEGGALMANAIERTLGRHAGQPTYASVKDAQGRVLWDQELPEDADRIETGGPVEIERLEFRPRWGA